MSQQQQPAQKKEKKSGGQQQQQQPRKEIRIQAFVKKVLSGDTVILVHPARPTQEKTVSFSNIQAPKLARKDDETEEPFAFEAREFVRRKCVGKLVDFVLEFTSDKARDFGSLFIEDTKENISLSLLQEGLATLKKNVRERDNEEYKPLKAAEESAKNAKKGVHADEKVKAAHVRQLKKATASAVYEKYKNQQINVVVEAVISGTLVRILTPTNENILMHMTGVTSPDHVKIENKDAPAEKKPSPPKKDVAAPADGAAPAAPADKKKPEKKDQGHKIPQPFAQEAKVFTESRLLQRDVTVIIEGVDKEDAIIGSVLGKGNASNPTFQEELLSKGLSKIAPWNVQKSSKFAARFKVAEDDAKRQKLRYWQFELREPKVPTKSSLNDSDKQEQVARVLDIVNADTLVVKFVGTGVEERIGISSIRSQRLARRQPVIRKQRTNKKDAQPQQQKQPEKKNVAETAEEIQHEPFAVEARELVRQRLAGKQVSIRVDYRRDLSAGAKKDDKKGGASAEKPVAENNNKKQGDNTRRFCTVLSEGKNIALELVQQGFATVIRHRQGEERSPFFSQLIAAEHEAENAKKGIHGSKKNFPVYHINDLSTKTVGQVQQYLKMFKETKKRAAVEKMFTATRMKLALPKDSMVINFSVLGINAPANRGQEKKPLADEAISFAKDHLLMRDVEIEVLEVDKNGSFSGQLFVNGVNYSDLLLKNGLGFVVPKAVAKLKNQQALQDIERDAKSAKKGVWGVEGFFDQKKKRDPESRPTRKFVTRGASDAPFNVRVTEVVNATDFYFQTADSAEQLEKLEEEMAALNLASQPAAASVKEGDAVFALFSADGAWYRGRVVKGASKDGKAKVQFIDFGNSEEVALSDIRTTVPDSIKQIPAQAQHATLAFAYYADQVYQDALQFTREFADNRDLIAQFEFETDAGKSYSLIDPVDKASLASLLVQNGLALVDKPYNVVKNPLFKPVIDELIKDLEAAKSDRVGTWEDGDVFDDDEDQ